MQSHITIKSNGSSSLHNKSLASYSNRRQTYERTQKSCLSEYSKQEHTSTSKIKILDNSFNGDENSLGGVKTMNKKGAQSTAKLHDATNHFVNKGH